MIIARLDFWPWNDAAALKDMGLRRDETRIFLHDAAGAGQPTHQVLFHVTSADRAESILRDGPQANVCKVGFTGAPSEKAFFCGNYPFVPHAIEQWMPHIDRREISIIKVLVALDVAAARYNFSPSWGKPEYALQPGDMLETKILPAEEFKAYRTPEAMARLKDYVEESIEEGEFVSSYIRAAVGLDQQVADLLKEAR